MLLTLAKGYGPAAATQVLLMMNQYITLMFVGTHLGADALAHFSVGITVYNVGGFSLAIGMSSTLDTLCSQAFGRDPRSAETAEHFVLGSAICVLMCVPVMLFYYHSHAALALVFEPSLAKGASVFLRASPLLLFVSVVLSCWNRLLYAQGRSTVPMLGMIIAVVLCPLLNWKLTPLGVEGSVAALTLTAIVQVTVIVVQVLRDPTIVFMQAFRPRFRWEVYTWARARSFLELGFASIVAVCSEWWVFEALNIVGARLSTVDLDSMAIFFSVSSLCFSVSYGWSASGGALVGNELGAGHPRTARAYAWLTILCCGLGAVVVAVVAALSSRRLFALYTTDEDVLSRLHQVLWLLIVFHIGDATQYVVQSVYRGASLQHQAARVTLATLWLVGLPCATWFALYPPFEWALPGLLGGFILGFVAEIPPLLIGLKNFDWPALSEAAQRAAAEEEAEEQADTPTSVQDADSQQPTPSENDPLH
jgi:MATE family multidrug resistance protein